MNENDQPTKLTLRFVGPILDGELANLWQRDFPCTVAVELPDGTTNKLSFTDLRILQLRAKADFDQDLPCYTEDVSPVIVPKLTVQAIKDAVAYLWDTGYWSGGWKDSDEYVHEPIDVPIGAANPYSE